MKKKIKKERAELLDKVWSELLQKFETLKEVTISPLKHQYSGIFLLDIQLPSIVKLNKEGAPVIKRGFQLIIKLSDNYPYEAPICKFEWSSLKPFHPHVLIRRRVLFLFTLEATWRDFQIYNPKESLADYLDRMLRSLIYETGYISTDDRYTVNPTALDFYRRRKDEKLFPLAALEKSSVHQDEEETRATGNNNLLSKKEVTKRINVRHVDALKKFEIQKKNTKFNIVTETPAYSPSQRARPVLEIIKKLNAELRGNYENDFEIYLLPKAQQAVFEHISWGEDTPENRMEQGGILLGDVFFDGRLGITYGIASKAITATYAEGSPISLEMNHQSWKQMIDKIDSTNRVEGGELQVIGWYHTHPKALDVFMSGTDIATQQRMFGYDWQFAIVLNPHKQIWRAFHGADARSCKGFIVKPEDKFENTNRQLLDNEYTKDKSLNNEIDRQQATIEIDTHKPSWMIEKFFWVILFLIILIIFLGIRIVFELISV